MTRLFPREQLEAIREAKAALRQSVHELPRVQGYHRVAHLLEDRPKPLKHATVIKVLGWVFRSQGYMNLRYLDEAGMTEWTTFGSMTDRQARSLSIILRRIE